MAFNIILKFKADLIKSKTLEMSLLPKYYKGLQQNLLKKTSVETDTDYFFCEDYSEGMPLLIMGNQTPAHKKVFRDAGKGKEGFDKSQISVGKAFILKEEDKCILCILPNPTLGKGKKLPTVKALNKLRRMYMKQIHDVRWLDAPLVASAQSEGAVESTSDTDVQQETSGNMDTSTDTPNPRSTETGTGSGGGNPQPNENAAQVDRSDIVKRAKDLQRGIKKIKEDVMPRYKEEQTTPKDAEFINAMRKAGSLFLTKLTQTDSKTKNEFKSNKEFLDQALPQWKELENRLRNSKGKAEMRAALKEKLETTVKAMNEIRQQIKDILKRTDLKKLA